MADKGGIKKKKKISKTLVILYIFLTIIVIIAFYQKFYINDVEDNNNKNVIICGTQPTPLIPIIFNNLTKNYEIFLGPVIGNEKEPLENVNVSIEFNRTIFYNLTNQDGFVTLHIPEKSIPINEFNTNKTVTLRAEGYEEMKF